MKARGDGTAEHKTAGEVCCGTLCFLSDLGKRVCLRVLYWQFIFRWI